MPTIVIELDGLRSLRGAYSEQVGLLDGVCAQLRSIRADLQLNVDAPTAAMATNSVEEAATLVGRQASLIRQLAEELRSYLAQVEAADRLSGIPALAPIQLPWLFRTVRRRLAGAISLQAIQDSLDELEPVGGPLRKLLTGQADALVASIVKGTSAVARNPGERSAGIGDRLRQLTRYTGDKAQGAKAWVEGLPGALENSLNGFLNRQVAQFQNIWQQAQRTYRATLDGLARIESLAGAFSAGAMRAFGRGRSALARGAGLAFRQVGSILAGFDLAFSHRFESVPLSDPPREVLKEGGIDVTVDINLPTRPPAQLQAKGSAKIVALEGGQLEITIDSHAAAGLALQIEKSGAFGSINRGELEAALLGAIGGGATYRISDTPINGRPAALVFVEQYLLRAGLVAIQLGGGPQGLIADQLRRQMAPLPPAIRTEIYQKALLETDVACSIFGVRTTGEGTAEVKIASIHDKERQETRFELSIQQNAEGEFMLPHPTFPILAAGPALRDQLEARVSCTVGTDGTLRSIEVSAAGFVGVGG